jgi:hypothetical protein
VPTSFAKKHASCDQAANASSSSGSEEENPRRSARSRSQTKFFTDSDDKMDVDSSSDAEESEDGMTEEEEAAVPTRKSSRSTAFRGEMKDPSNSIADLLKIADAADANRAKSKRTKRTSSLEDTPSGESDEESVPKRSTRVPPKSPAKRHTRKRMSKAPEHHSESSDAESDEESEEESEEEEEEMKFSKIIASKSLTLREWQGVTYNINTTEITNGSRWIQEAIPNENLDRFEERFLVKWNDLSHLHCSWETEKDLVEFCDGAKGRLSTFFRKSVGGLLYDADERLDGVSCCCYVIVWGASDADSYN